MDYFKAGLFTQYLKDVHNITFPDSNSPTDQISVDDNLGFLYGSIGHDLIFHTVGTGSPVNGFDEIWWNSLPEIERIKQKYIDSHLSVTNGISLAYNNIVACITQLKTNGIVLNFKQNSEEEQALIRGVTSGVSFVLSAIGIPFGAFIGKGMGEIVGIFSATTKDAQIIQGWIDTVNSSKTYIHDQLHDRLDELNYWAKSLTDRGVTIPVVRLSPLGKRVVDANFDFNQTNPTPDPTPEPDPIPNPHPNVKTFSAPKSNAPYAIAIALIFFLFLITRKRNVSK